MLSHPQTTLRCLLLLCCACASCSSSTDDEPADSKTSHAKPKASTDDTQSPPNTKAEPASKATSQTEAKANHHDPAAPSQGESRLKRLERLAIGPENDSLFDVNMLSLTLGENMGVEARTGRRKKGIILEMNGLITNGTGRTLINGELQGVLVLHFEANTIKIALSPDALEDPATSDEPWRPGAVRKFTAKTYILPTILQEYTPKLAQARLLARFENPITYHAEAIIWSLDIDWLITRGSPVQGKATAFKREGLRVGPRSRIHGQLQTGESVDLLYQKGNDFKVQSNAGVGWVSNDTLRLKSLDIYEEAEPHGGERTAQDEFVALKIESIDEPTHPPTGAKLKEGERLLTVTVALTNKSEKDIRCSDFYIDFGPTHQPPPSTDTQRFEDALDCDKGRLAPQTSARGKIAFVRGRYDVPFALGYVSPSRRPLIIDIYDPKWTKTGP